MHVTELKSVGHIQPSPDWSMPRHRHRHHECIVVLDGRFQITTGSTVIDAGKGDVLLYPAGCWHVERSSAAHPVETIFLSFFGDCGTAIRCVHDQRQRCRQLARWLLTEQRDQQPDTGITRPLLDSLAAEIDRAEAEPPAHGMISVVRSAIIAAPHHPWDLAGLAALVYLSRSHFCRRYAALTDLTPMQDLKRLRLQAALDLIRTTDLPLRVVADRCGFSNEFHLSRCCRQLTGRPPSHHR